MCDRSIAKPNKGCEFKQARGNNRSRLCPYAEGEQRGSGVTGAPDYPAGVMEETHLLPRHHLRHREEEKYVDSSLLPVFQSPDSNSVSPPLKARIQLTQEAWKHSLQGAALLIYRAEQEKSEKDIQ